MSTFEERIRSAIIKAEILWEDDPESSWTWREEPRDLPDECECGYDLVNSAYGTTSEPEPTECSCDDTKMIHIPPRQTTYWRVVLTNAFYTPEELGRGRGQSHAEAYLDAVANATAKYLATMKDDL